MSIEYAPTWAALLGAVAYGTGDFIGGRVARRLGTLSAVAIAQAVAVAFMLQDYALAEELLPAGAQGWVCVAAGIAYAIGVISIYEGIAHGCITIVASICGLLSILVPLAGDFMFGRAVSQYELAGMALCAAAVVLIVAASADSEDRGSIACSVQLGVVGGIGFGIADLSLGTMPPELSAGALFMTRSIAATAAVVLAVSLAARLSWKHSAFGAPAEVAGAFVAPAPASTPHRSTVAASGLTACVVLAAMAGLLDALGHTGYVHAATRGSMGVAAALVAIFPAVTVVLAAVLLRERVTRLQLVGFGIGATGIVFISN